MKVYIDDGSTNVKLVYMDGKGKRHQNITQNSFKRGFSSNFGGLKASNYTIDGEKYSFDPLNSEALKTREVRYQYGDLNLLAVHHALHASDIEPQLVDVVVSLPISEYFTADNQPNDANIERKKKNLMRPLAVMGRETFVIDSVTVLPESLPAGFYLLEDMPETLSLLIVDLGGTTLDLSQMSGQATQILRVAGHSTIGVNLMTEAVRAAMEAAHTPTSQTMADLMIQHRDDDAFLSDHLNDPAQLPLLKKALADSQKMLINRVIEAVDEFRGYSHMMIIGGGAVLVADALKAHAQLRDDRFIHNATSQFDLVYGMQRVLP